MKLTVSEYAKRLNVSVQTIYKKIKRGVLTTIIEDGITYVIADVSEVKQEVKQDDSDYCKQLLKIIKTQQKEIKRLTKKNEKQNKFLISKYENALPSPKKQNQDDTIDVKFKEKNKKKSKKNKGKK